MPTTLLTGPMEATEVMTDMQRTSPPLVPQPYDRNRDNFSDMLAVAVEVQGNELVKEDIADALSCVEACGKGKDCTHRGVPFLITHVTFRRGMMDPKEKGRMLAYVSCEIVVADEAFLTSRKLNLDNSPFRPSDHLVLNDGSTGVYRQVMAVLESQGYIALPEGPVQAPKGESRFDLPPSEWDEIVVGESWIGDVGTDNEGFMLYATDVRIFAPRGLRLSEYSNDYTQDGKTRYLA